MKNLLLKNFLSNPQLYGRAQTRWRSYVESLAEAAGTPYESYPDDGADPDGNPLYGAQFPRRNRAVKVVQIDAKEAKLYPPLIGWVDTLPSQQGKGQATRELTVFLVLTKKTERIAQSWIQNWLVNEWSPRELERKIKEESVLTVGGL